MQDQRDRLLGMMFVIQLVGALVLGFVVVNAIGDGDVGGQVVIADGAGTAGGGTTTTTGTGATTTGTGSGTTTGRTDTSGGTTSSGATTGTSGSNGGSTTTTTTTTTTDSGGGDAGAPADQGGAAPADDGGAAPAPQDGATTDAADAPPPAPDARPAEETRTGISDDEILVGVLVTQTGAINFRSSAQATKAYFDRLNESGGINGRTVRPIIRDDQLDANIGAQAVEEMINAGVFAFVAFNAPLSEQTVLTTIEEANIPLIGAFAIPASPVGYIFSSPYETFGRVGGRTLGEQDITTPALIYLSNQQESTDVLIAESYRQGLQAAGLELDDGNIHVVDVTTPQFDDIVTDMRLNGVDGIATILEATAMKRLQQSMNRAAFAPVHIASPFGGDPAVIRDPDLGGSFEGTLVLSDVDFLGTPGEVATYEAEVSRRFGGDAELNWAGQHGWLGAKVFSDAMASLGQDPTREALLERMNGLSEYASGMTRPLRITADPVTHRTNNQCMKVGVVESGQVTQIADWECPPLSLEEGYQP